MSADVEQVKRHMIVVDHEHAEAVACEGLAGLEGPREMHPLDVRQDLRKQGSLNDRGRVQIASDSAVRVAQLTFGVFALGDVSDGGDDQRSGDHLHRTEADVERHFDAVFPDTVEIPLGTHRSDVRCPRELFPRRSVSAPYSVRDEQLNTLAEELGGSVAEQLLGLRVGEHDPPVSVDGDHRVRCVLEQLQVLEPRHLL